MARAVEKVSMRAPLEPGTLALAVERSGNRKIGEAATTYAAQASCPGDCPLLDGGGCYAETGQIGKFVTEPLNRAAGGAAPAEVARAEARAIDGLTAQSGRPLRLHTVGDCPDAGSARIVAAAAARYRARGGGPVWTYTHAWRTVPREAWGNVSVLASCETAAELHEAASRGYATALVVEEFPGDKAYRIREARPTPAGALPATAAREGGGDEPGPLSPSRIVPCPAQTRDRSCTTCGLCFDDQRLRRIGATIGFALHGIPATVRAGRRTLRGDDPRETVEDAIRGLLEARPDATAREAAEAAGTARTYAWQVLRYLRGGPHPSATRRARHDRQIARERAADDPGRCGFRDGRGRCRERRPCPRHTS